MKRLMQQISAVLMILMMLGVNTQVFGIRYAAHPKPTKGQPAAGQPATSPVVTQPTEEELEAELLMPHVETPETITTQNDIKAEFQKAFPDPNDRENVEKTLYKASERAGYTLGLLGYNNPTLASITKALEKKEFAYLRNALPTVSTKDLGEYFYDQFATRASMGDTAYAVK